MGDAGMVQLLVRTAVSLAVVLCLIGVAYVVARRRGGQLPGRSPGRAPGRAARGAAPRRAPASLESVARIGLSRGSAAVAVRFADRVVLLGVAEGAPISVLHELPAERWDELAEREQVVATPVAALHPASGVAARPGFVEALREATARRG